MAPGTLSARHQKIVARSLDKLRAMSYIEDMRRAIRPAQDGTEATMTKTYISGAKLTIRRADGNVETVVNTQHARNGVIPEALFAKMVAATKAAGRGDILSQEPNVVEVSLAAQRAEIAGRLQDCAGAYPGSQAWRQARALESDLAAFDAAHPEVIAKLQAERAARLAEGVNRALRMED